MIARFLLGLACSVSCYFILDSYYGFPRSLLGLILGLLIALLVTKLEEAIKNIPLSNIFGGIVGIIFSLLIAILLAYGLSFAGNITEKHQVVPLIYALLIGIMGYLGLVIGAKKIEEFHYFGWGQVKGEQDVRILDTSVIIDGRIADISDAGFIQGTLTVPRFVLDELQYIADSADSLKRSRGRRGLDILNRMQKSTGINIEISDQDFPKIKAVDAKLVALANIMTGTIITNDFNLNKVAELQGVKILNVNQLANAMKPVVLPGEMMTVKIVKDGKESGQGVAYLDDGTMIIVDNAQRHHGSNVVVMVTSVLQTTAGRMIFSEFREVVLEREALAIDGKR